MAVDRHFPNVFERMVVSPSTHPFLAKAFVLEGLEGTQIRHRHYWKMSLGWCEMFQNFPMYRQTCELVYYDDDDDGHISVAAAVDDDAWGYHDEYLVERAKESVPPFVNPKILDVSTEWGERDLVRW